MCDLLWMINLPCGTKCPLSFSNFLLISKRARKKRIGLSEFLCRQTILIAANSVISHKSILMNDFHQPARHQSFINDPSLHLLSATAMCIGFLDFGFFNSSPRFDMVWGGHALVHNQRAHYCND